MNEQSSTGTIKQLTNSWVSVCPILDIHPSGGTKGQRKAVQQIYHRGNENKHHRVRGGEENVWNEVWEFVDIVNLYGNITLYTPSLEAMIWDQGFDL